MHGEIATAQAARGRVRIGRRDREVATHAEEHLRAAVDHRLDRADGVEPVLARRLEAEHVAHAIEERRRRLLVDHHRAVALHVAVAAHRARARARAAQMAAQQQQVDEHVDRRHRVLVLGDAHAPARDQAFARQIQLAGAAELRLVEPGFLDDRLPGLGHDVGDEGVETRRVLGDEGVVEQRGAAVAGDLDVALEHVLDHALDRREIAADLELEIVRRDPRRPVGRHLHLVLRIGEAFQAALAQRVERDDPGAALRGLAQLAEHARMVRAGVLAEDEDAVGFFEILQRHRALADADLLLQRGARRLVAHVGAVGEVVGAVFAHEQLVQERGLVRGAARGVEDRLVGRGQGIEMPGDRRERIVPGHRHVVVAGRVVAHRRRQPALVLQPVVAVGRQLRDAVLREQLGPGAMPGRLGGDGLGAVLAELERGGVVAVGPGAAGAVEAVGLVGLQQRLRTADGDVLLQQMGRDRLQRAPATGGTVVLADRALVAHGVALLPGRAAASGGAGSGSSRCAWV